MPQIDKAPILTIVFWLSILYVFQYLLLSMSHMQLFISSFKLKLRRLLYVSYLNSVSRRQLALVLFFPWIYDFSEPVPAIRRRK